MTTGLPSLLTEETLSLVMAGIHDKMVTKGELHPFLQ